MLARRFVVIAMTLALAACSTPRKSRLAIGAGGFVVGLGVGAAVAPKDERSELHAMYWAGLLGLAGLIASEFYFSEADESARLKLENEKLQADMELMRNANTVLLKQGQGYFKGASGEEYFQSGKAKWRLYQVDKWNKDGPNRLIHTDRMVELLPAGDEK